MENAIKIKEKGDEYLNQAEYIQAIKYYDEAIEARPQYAGAHFNRGQALFKLKKYLEAANSFTLAWLHARFDHTSLLLCAKALVLAEFTDEACAVYDKLPISKLDDLSLLCFADALRIQMCTEKAYEVVKLVKRIDLININLVLAGIQVDRGRHEEAFELLMKEKNGDNTGYCFDRLISCFYARKDLDGLLEILGEAVERFPHIDYYKAHIRCISKWLKKSHPINIKDSGSSAYFEDGFNYFLPYLNQGLNYAGTIFQTFETCVPLTPENGLILEFGVRNGHSINFLANLFEGRKVYGFDSFEGIPDSCGNEPAGSYSTHGNIPIVQNNVELVVGWFDKTLPIFKKNHSNSIAFMNIDCDIYSSTKTIFDELSQQIIVGTIIVFDEYIGNPTWREDEYKAFQEWVSANNATYEYISVSFYTKQVAVRITFKG